MKPLYESERRQQKLNTLEKIASLGLLSGPVTCFAAGAYHGATGDDLGAKIGGIGGAAHSVLIAPWSLTAPEKYDRGIASLESEFGALFAIPFLGFVDLAVYMAGYYIGKQF
ncbi:hypothetical protein J4437_05860 [Candidatus Woesearchaeota archaeon]|nr:hypothetical protein [Candidatus Woesearchaeota archaeon]